MSPIDPTLTSVLNTAIGAIPSILALIRADHAVKNPTAPPLTDADVFAALNAAVISTLATDAELRAGYLAKLAATAHPKGPVTGGPAGDTGD